MVKLEVDSAKKVFHVTVSGIVTAEDAQRYLNELEEKVKGVDPKQYILLIDAREQKTLTADATPLLEKCMKFYTETPFRKRFSVILESAIAMLQVKKVSKEAVDEFIMVSSVEEAYKNI